MSRISLAALAAFAIVATLPGASQPSSEWPTYPASEAPAVWHASVSRGDLIIATVNAAIRNELDRHLTYGLADPLQACHLAAIGASYGFAREGIAVGRTSARLRNPANRPRPWMAAVVARYAVARARDVDGFVVDLGDRIGLLRPIVEQPMCDRCHGPVDTVDLTVRSELARRYPADRALGFRSGDVRGWYWVELPKQ